MQAFETTKSVSTSCFPLTGFLLAALSFVLVHAFAYAQPGGLGCLVDAGISPQEVCIDDHIFLGGNPAVPEALANEIASVQWVVLSGDPNIDFFPSAEVENPQVYVEEPTTFGVTLVLNDGSVCTDEITLLPIESPTLNFPESIVQCDGNLEVQFINLTPSNSVYITYNVDWGDGNVETLSWADGFQHEYEQAGAYTVNIQGLLGSCPAAATIDVFVGTVPENPMLIVPASVCSSSSLEVVWANLSNYAWGTAWSLEMEGVQAYTGIVGAASSDTLVLEIGSVTNCVDVLGQQSLFAEALNLCSTIPSASNAEVEVQFEPVADISVVGDSCAQVTLAVGDGSFCPEFLDLSWEVTQGGSAANLVTLAGGATQSYWVALADSGHYEVVLQASNSGCGTDSDTAAFCIEMPTPTHWSVGDMVNGAALTRCIGDSILLGIDSLIPVCQDSLSISWSVTSLNEQGDAGSVGMTTESDFQRWFAFNDLGHYLIQVSGGAGCSDFVLSASVLITEVPELTLSSYDSGLMADSVMCIGEDVSVVASLDAYQLENGAYSLSWELLDVNGDPSSVASFEEFGDSTIVITALQAGEVWVALEVSGACGTASDTLALFVEGPYPNNYNLLDGVESLLPSNYPIYTQCFGDTLVLEYDAPWAAEVNISSEALNIVDLEITSPPNGGIISWLSAGENLWFDIEYESWAGCVYYDSLSFRSVLLPEIHVFDPEVVCGGDSALFEAEIIPGSTSIMESYTWYSVPSADLDLSLGDTVGVTDVPAFWDVPPCIVGLHIHASVTDANGCVGETPQPATIYPNCPLPPTTEGTVYSCTETGALATVNLQGSPAGGVWSGPEDVEFEADFSTATATATDADSYLYLTYSVTDIMGCESSADLCWIEAAADSSGACTFAELCEDPAACNYGHPPTCGVECIYLSDLPDANIGWDTLTVCQSFQPVWLDPVQPNMGTWTGPGVFQNDNLFGNNAWLNVSSAGEGYIYFQGGFGNCSSLDSAYVVVHPSPTHIHIDHIAACSGSTLAFHFDAEGTGDLCWSFGWYDQDLPPCGLEPFWEVNENGFVRWAVTDSLGCSSEMVFEVEDWGTPNAIAGGDTTLCLSSVPDIMNFEYGAPLALGCNPSESMWSGEGASFEYFAEVWSDGNCVQPSTPWTDSVWVFQSSSLGDFEWIWTVVDCHGCVDSDTITISVVEPTPPLIPSLDFCLEDPVGPLTTQEGACWTGAGIDPNFVFDPAVAGVGEHVWVAAIGEGSCAVTDTVVAVVNPNPEPVLLSVGENPCIGTPFEMCLDPASPGADSWTVEWSSYPNMNSTESCEGLCCELDNAQSGMVAAEVTDTKGCTSVAEQVVILALTEQVSVPSSLSFCQDGGAYPLLGGLPAAGVWSGDMVNENQEFMTTEQGLFEAVYTFESVDGCVSQGVTQIEVSSVPEPEIATPPSSICLFAPFLLQSADNGTWVGEGINADGSIQVAQPGTYTYQLVVGEGSCFAMDEVEIEVLPLPSSDILTMFEGTSTTLCSTTPVDIAISEDYITANNIVNGFALGCEGLTGEFPYFEFLPSDDCDITVVVYDENGCSAIEQHSVVVPNAQPFDAGPGLVLCLGDSVNLSTGIVVPPCHDVVWAGECVSDNTSWAAPSEVGLCVAELHVVDCNGCLLTGEREVLALDVPTVNIAWEDTVVCDGQEVDMAVEVYGGSLSYEWTWIDGGVVASPDTPWVAVNDGLAPIQVSVSVQAENLCGINQDISTITVNPSLELTPNSNGDGAAFEDAVVCAPVYLDYAAEAPGATEWVWSDWLIADSANPSASSFILESVDSVTVVNLTVQAGLSASMCSNPLEWSLTVVPEPTAELDAEVTSFCGESMMPDVQFEATNGAIEWAWTGGELSPNFPEGWIIDSSGTTTLTLTTSSEYPGATCSAVATLPLQLYPQPVAQFNLLSDSVSCAPGTFEIQDLSQDAISIAWFVDYVGGVLDPGETLNLLLPIAGQYSMVWAAIGEGGCSDTLYVSDVLEVLPSPDAAIWSSQPPFVPWSMEGTEFVFNDVSLGGDSTIWTVGDSTIVDEDILAFFYEDPGVYAISQQVINEFGCSDTVSFRFEIIDELAIHVPTAFTPNGDDINDVWKPVIAGESRIEGYHLQVISRSHQVMFETFDPSRGWDALDVPRAERLEDVQNSVFMYVLRVLPEATPLEPEPKWLEYTGHVMIVD